MKRILAFCIACVAALPALAQTAGEAIPQHEAFRRVDPTGVLMAITAMMVVFTALALLFFLFKWLGLVMVRVTGRRAAAAPVPAAVTKSSELIATANKRSSAFVGEEEIAAIAMALNRFQEEIHDKQSAVLTINRVARAYSPWSSKIYGLRQTPNKK